MEAITILYFFSSKSIFLRLEGSDKLAFGASVCLRLSGGIEVPSSLLEYNDHFLFPVIPFHDLGGGRRQEIWIRG
jgi:hypothetical protein